MTASEWEVVSHRPLPAIPEPTTTPLPQLLDACTAVVAWADQCEDAEEVQEVYERMVAIAKYLSRQDHALAAETALRRLEERIGELTPSKQGRRTDRELLPREGEVRPLNRTQASEFRRMAAHPEVVEHVIAESTEDDPPSRRKVLAAVKELEKVAKEETVKSRKAPRRPFMEGVERSGWQLRNAAERMAVIGTDDRFRANTDELRRVLHSHLTYTYEVCGDLLDRLEAS